MLTFAANENSMTLNSIRKIRLPRKLKKTRKMAEMYAVAGHPYKFANEADLKEKYRYSKDDLEHLFV